MREARDERIAAAGKRRDARELRRRGRKSKGKRIVVVQPAELEAATSTAKDGPSPLKPPRENTESGGK
jgi:hypothetical protein